MRAGLHPDRVIFAEADCEQDVLSNMEEGLGYGGLGGVVGEIVRLPMTTSRRLQLAAEKTGTMGLVVRRWRRQTEASDFGQPTASTTRWRVSVLPSEELPVPGVGRPRWLLELMRVKAGECAEFVVGAAMPRAVSIFLPDLPIERIRRMDGTTELSLERPLVSVARSGSKRLIAADAKAREAGIRIGMPAAKAQAMVRGLQFLNADRRRHFGHSQEQVVACTGKFGANIATARRGRWFESFQEKKEAICKLRCKTAPTVGSEILISI